MRLKLGFYRSRVARRVLLMFVLGSIVPITIASTLAFKHVESSLKQQTYAKLRHATKFYGLSVLDRLLSAQTKLRRVADGVDVIAYVSNDAYAFPTHEFNLIARVGPGGKVQPLAGNARDEIGPLSSTDISPDMGKAAVFAVPANGQHNAKIFVSVTSQALGADGVRFIAELNNDFLWGKEDNRPLAFGFCALVDEQPIYCTPSLFGRLPKDLGAALADSVSGAFSWSVAGENYLAVQRELFLPSRFDTHPWVFVAAQSEAEAFQPIHAFRRLFPGVMLISILSILLVVIGQIRRRLEPLGRLTEGTRKLADGQFDSRITVQSDDEFQELAGSFNYMASSLGQQFRALTAMSQIDTVILATPDFQQVIETVLQHIPEFVSADNAGVVLLNQDNRMLSRLYSKDLTKDAGLLVETISIGDGDVEYLTELGSGKQYSTTAPRPHFLEPIAGHGAQWISVFPLEFEERLLGFLYLARATQTEIVGDKLEQTRNIIGRLTVALSAVERQRQLYRRAHFDALTELPNRELFRDRLAQEIAHAKREQHRIGVLFIDLDRFKQVNDALGHAGGDDLLRQAARRLRSCVRESDTVARLSGDEFIICLSSVNRSQAAAAVANEIIQSLSSPFEVKQQEFFLSASIGIALYPSDGDSPADLLRNADTAMYRAKSEGRGRYLFFQEQMNIEAIERTVLETDLRHALMRSEFELYFQPQVDVQTWRVVAAESLLRWHHPERGVLEPNKYIALAEESGLIETIGAWVVESACAQLRDWRLAGIPIQRIAVNVSGRQFLRSGFIDVVRDALDSAHLEPQDLELEITESELIADLSEADQTVAQLQSLGVKIAIDDFGTGYSALSYLQHFPVDVLKIDRSFVQNIDTSNNARAIIDSIIALARGLNKIVVAEGVEEQSHVRFLTENRCDLLQGFYFSQPLTAPNFAEFARREIQQICEHRNWIGA